MSLRRMTLICLCLGVTLQGCSPVCDGVEDLVLAVDMRHEPVFKAENGACRQISPDNEKLDGEFFADSACQKVITYKPRSFMTFCKQNLESDQFTKDAIGNPKLWTADELDSGAPGRETKWSLSHGSRLKLVALDQTRERRRPFVKKVEYRQAGACALAMHIYKADPAAENLKPAIFFHGGGWKFRGALSIAGIETAAPNFTDRGFIVFSPFYRLLESSDGPKECQNSDGDMIIEDTEAALAWVLENGHRYGMDPSFAKEGPVLVAGQSAGGHLAGFLAVNNKEIVDRAVLLYPATDLPFLAENLKPGGIYEGEFDNAKGLLLAFADASNLDDIRMTERAVSGTRFPEVVAQDPKSFPEFFIIAGSADATVPIEQSTRLCQARNGQTPSAERYSADATQTFDCDTGRLTVVEGADHILDLRCFSGKLTPLINDLLKDDAFCRAGSSRGEKEVKEALNKIYEGLGQAQ